MAYLHQKNKFSLAYDQTYPMIDYSNFYKYDCNEFFKDTKEEISLNAPKLREKELELYLFVDSDHATEIDEAV